MRIKKRLAILSILAVAAILARPAVLRADEPDMAQYTSMPIFISSSVAPNVMIILDNSGSMNARAYSHEDYDNTSDYYGYFEPHKMYTWDGNDFVRDASGAWDGNFMNWAAMRRVDVVRKVIMGGKATSRTGGGNQTNIGADNNDVWDVRYTADPANEDAPHYTRDTTFKLSAADAALYTPYNVDLYFRLDGGYLYIDDDADLAADWNKDPWPVRFSIRVKKDITKADEAASFVDGNIAGVMQKVGDRARWGLEFFNYGTGNNGDGGTIERRIGTNMTDLITSISNTAANTWTPLAESYYVCSQYFKQEAIPDTFTHNYPQQVFTINETNDPYLNSGVALPCAKSFVILLTDGLSTMDLNVPPELKDYDSDSNDDFAGAYTGDFDDQTTDITYNDSGSNYLDDIALYARTTDLRGDLDGSQNLILYAIYAFGDLTHADSQKALRDLKDAAKNGGFEDKNGNNTPDLDEEWDEDEDGQPDTFYQASNGYELEQKLLKAITDILKRASSGTAVSVLATSSEGEGTLVQAYFKPSVSTGTEDVDWVGYLHSLWVDSQGRLREDTPEQGAKPGLVLSHDKIVEFFFDSATGQARFNRFTVDSTGEKSVDGNGDYIYTDHPIEELNAIWEAGDKLAQRDPDLRRIYTFVDKDNDETVDSGEYIEFIPGNSSDITPYLGVATASPDSHLGATQSDRVNNLIRFVRGEDHQAAGNGFTGNPDLRYRNIDGNIWKLGDIVHSTPVTLGRPVDNYGIIYGDSSYQDYLSEYIDRETVVYVGGNDGMLHAFLMGKFVRGDNPDTAAITEQVYMDREATTTEGYGDELWAYIPQALLPHLKWMATPDYTHVYYVDLKPRIFDARIFPQTGDPVHPNGWGTVLVGGLNYGGKDIIVNEDFNGDGDTGDAGDTRTFKSCYFAIDITDPHDPVLLWERTYTDLSLTTVFPTVAKVGDTWFVILGSGPTDYEGVSSHNGRIYVVNMATGALLRSYQTGENSSFMGSPITVDIGLNYNVDVGYIGETYPQGQSWAGQLYTFRVPIDQNGDYDEDPTNWTFSSLVSADGPVTAPPSASIDDLDNLWVYFGTGRYFSDDDKTNTDTQYYYGIKDPYYNPKLTEQEKTDKLSGADPFDILNVTSIDVYTDGTIDDHPDNIGTFDAMVTDMDNNYDGWRLSLGQSADEIGERVLTKPAVIGGIVLQTTFVPNQDPCGYGGNSNLLGLFYKTGTAYTRAIFEEGLEDVTVGGEEKTKVVRKVDIGIGKGSAVAIHVGKKEGATGYVQQSTGIVMELDINPAFNIKSGFIRWRER